MTFPVGRFWDYVGRMYEMARRKPVERGWFDIPMWVYNAAREQAGIEQPGNDGDTVTMVGLPVRALVSMLADALRFVETPHA